MRTTVRLNDDLLRRAKMRAAAEGTTLTALIERGLEAVLVNAGSQPHGVREDARTFTAEPTNPLLAMTPYTLPEAPTSSAGFLDFITDPIELTRALEFESDREAFIRSGGK